MAVEDFTTYTEVDASNYFTVTSTKVTVTNILRSATGHWVFADKTAGHFGDFEHLITFNITAADLSSNVGSYGINNGMNDGEPDWVAQNPNINISPSRSSSTGGGIIRFIMRCCEGQTMDRYDANAATPYYCTVKRAGTAGTCKIYSDGARTNLLDTLSLVTSTTTMRYIHVACSTNDTAGGNISTYSENLDLQETPPPPPSGSDFIPNYFDATFVS